LPSLHLRVAALVVASPPPLHPPPPRPPPPRPSVPLRLSSYRSGLVARPFLFHPRERAGMPPRRGISASIGCLFNLRIRRLVSPQVRKGRLRPVRLNSLVGKRVTRRSTLSRSSFVHTSLMPFSAIVRASVRGSSVAGHAIILAAYVNDRRLSGARRFGGGRTPPATRRSIPRLCPMYKNEAAKLTSAITRHATLRSVQSQGDYGRAG